MYSSFFPRSSFPRFLSFTGEQCSVEFGGKAPVIFCPRSFPLFPGVSATVSTHLVTPTAVPGLNSFHQRSICGFFGNRSARLPTETSVLKTETLYLYFLWRKGYYFRPYGFGQSFGSSCSTSPLNDLYSFSVHPVMECM